MGQDVFKLKVTGHSKHENCLLKKKSRFNELASGIYLIGLGAVNINGSCWNVVKSKF